MAKKISRAHGVGVQENAESPPLRQSGMDSNTPPNTTENSQGKGSNDEEKIDKKRGRGLSKLNLVSGQKKPKEFERNEYGQPVGDESVKYASFLGCITREFVPYTLDGWDKLPGDVKNNMWSCLKEKSAKFRAMRAKQVHNHTTSRKGYARLAEKLKKLKEYPPGSQNTINIANDALSLVFGKEVRGRVRGMVLELHHQKLEHKYSKMEIINNFKMRCISYKRNGKK